MIRILYTLSSIFRSQLPMRLIQVSAILGLVFTAADVAASERRRPVDNPSAHGGYASSPSANVYSPRVTHSSSAKSPTQNSNSNRSYYSTSKRSLTHEQQMNMSKQGLSISKEHLDNRNPESGRIVIISGSGSTGSVASNTDGIYIPDWRKNLDAQRSSNPMAGYPTSAPSFNVFDPTPYQTNK